jgi:hypothetical protein
VIGRHAQARSPSGPTRRAGLLALAPCRGPFRSGPANRSSPVAAAIVQPYEGSIDDVGETGMVDLDGDFSHAGAKRALLRPDAGEVDPRWEREIMSASKPETINSPWPSYVTGRK